MNECRLHIQLYFQNRFSIDPCRYMYYIHVGIYRTCIGMYILVIVNHTHKNILTHDVHNRMNCKFDGCPTAEMQQALQHKALVQNISRNRADLTPWHTIRREGGSERWPAGPCTCYVHVPYVHVELSSTTAQQDTRKGIPIKNVVAQLLNHGWSQNTDVT